MNAIVHPDQTGFIAGRNIGENSLLIYDVIHDFTSKNKNGLTMVIYYSTAFGTIEWNIINDSLKKLTLGSI